MKIKLEIVTPEENAFSEEVDQVVLPGIEGEFGVLPGHETLMTQILPGELVVTQNNKVHYLAVGEGFVEVRPDRVSVLTDMALRADDINEMEAEEARKRAEEALAHKRPHLFKLPCKGPSFSSMSNADATPERLW
jgi:F-type H+-transporting ATPase subunit epsilon